MQIKGSVRRFPNEELQSIDLIHEIGMFAIKVFSGGKLHLGSDQVHVPVPVNHTGEYVGIRRLGSIFFISSLPVCLAKAGKKCSEVWESSSSISKAFLELWKPYLPGFYLRVADLATGRFTFSDRGLL